MPDHATSAAYNSVNRWLLAFSGGVVLGLCAPAAGCHRAPQPAEPAIQAQPELM